jgi:hypothetical protein
MQDSSGSGFICTNYDPLNASFIGRYSLCDDLVTTARVKGRRQPRASAPLDHRTSNYDSLNASFYGLASLCDLVTVAPQKKR